MFDKAAVSSFKDRNLYQTTKSRIYVWSLCLSLCQEMVDLHSTKVGIFSQTKKTQRMGWGGPDMQVATSMVLVKVVVDCISTLREKVRIAPVKEIA